MKALKRPTHPKWLRKMKASWKINATDDDDSDNVGAASASKPSKGATA